MKTITIFLSIAGLFVSNLLIGQNITNTLGTSGVFKIKDGSADYLTLSQSTGYLSLNRSMDLPNTSNSTTGIVFKGGERFLHNYGIGNTFLGRNSGNFTMSGNENTAVGYNSLYWNTTGNFNTAVGGQSLLSNTTGNRNIAVGSRSLLYNTTGSNNTAIGYESLNSNSTGIENTAVGSESLFNNNGDLNTAVGFRSLLINTTGYQNTAIGNETLRNNNGSENTAVGFKSLYSNTTGIENTSMGFGSLYSNTVNSGNTAVGYYSLFASTGWNNTAMGHHSMQNNTGNYNTAFGYNSGSTITTGSNLTCLGIDANPTSGTANDQITLGNGFVSSLRCNVQTITSLSDARDKKNVKELSLGLDFITKLHPRQFNWDKREWYDDNVSDGSKMKEAPTAGFIAQELDEAQTNENADWLNLVLKDNPEKWEATYGNLLPVVVKAIQDLKSEKDNEIAELKTENDELKSNNEKLSAEVESLKTMSEKIAKLEQLVNDLTAVKNVSFTENK